MSDQIFEKLTRRELMLDTQKGLIDLGERGLPYLESVLDGSAKNKFGVAYYNQGLPLTSCLEVIARLGNIAKPLEGYLAEELTKMNPSALSAIGSFSDITLDTIKALASTLAKGSLFSYEAAHMLKKLNLLEHPEILKAMLSSNTARNIVIKIKSA